MLKRYGFQTTTIYFSDFETYSTDSQYYHTYHDTQAYIVSSVRSFLYYDKQNKKWALKNENENERFKKVIQNKEGVIKDYIDFYMNIWNIKTQKLGNHQIHFFHNGGKFDFIFILKYLINSKCAKVVLNEDIDKAEVEYNKLYFCVVWSNSFRKITIFKYLKEGDRYRKITMEFRDSYLIFKESVKSIGNTLQKMGYDIAKGDTKRIIKEGEDNITQELIDYVVNDSLIVCLLFESMVNYYPKSSVLPNTTASWAKSAFLSKKEGKATDTFRIVDMELNEEQQKDLNTIFENYYVGGLSSLNERYQFKRIKNVWLEDVVSQYPHKMRNFKMPCGVPKIIENKEEWESYLKQNKANLESGEYACFINFKYTNIKQNKNVPNFLKNYKQEDNNNYLKYQSFLNELDWKDTYLCWLQFERLVKYESREFVIAYVFEKTKYLFNDYINNFFSMKNEAKKLKEVAKEKYAKLMLNSLYGKFGEKGVRLQQVFKEILDIMNHDNIVEVKGERVIDNLGMINIVKSSESAFSYFQIASYITSLARMWLFKRWNEIVNLGGIVYYCDTDSNFFSLSNEKLKDLTFGSNLGDWELNNEIFNNFYILAPKTYVAYDNDKTINKIACKGINKDIVLSKGVEHLINNEEYTILDKKVIKSGIILFETTKRIMTSKTFDMIKKMSALFS